MKAASEQTSEVQVYAQLLKMIPWLAERDYPPVYTFRVVPGRHRRWKEKHGQAASLLKSRMDLNAPRRSSRYSSPAFALITLVVFEALRPRAQRPRPGSVRKHSWTKIYENRILGQSGGMRS